MSDLELSKSRDFAFPHHMRRADAARYIRETYAIPCVTTTLAKYACSTGDGPPFRKAGKFPIYAREDLDEWAKRRLGKLMRSTSELIDQNPLCKAIADDAREREQQSERPL
jgi:hypothetical protein